LGLDQRTVARAVGVAADTLRNWEKGRTEPEVRFLPALIAFVDHNPLPRPDTCGQALRRRRMSLGLSQERLAALARVDEGSVRRLEADTKGMARRVLQAVRTVLELAED
jgi:transcriptional regulator with XRE-family HTH domain